VTDITQMLGQPTLWGLTIGQTVLVFAFSAGLIALLVVLRYLLQLTVELLQIGCAVIQVFSCGLAGFLVLYNFANGMFK